MSSADHDVLARIAASGRDMNLPLEVDFAVDCRDVHQANLATAKLVKSGYRCDVSIEPDEPIVLYIKVQITPTYENLVSVRSRSLEEFDLAADDWGALV